MDGKLLGIVPMMSAGGMGQGKKNDDNKPSIPGIGIYMVI